MNDLSTALEIIQKNYKKYNESVPIVKEFVLGYRWFMVSDTKDRLSMALRVGQEKELDEYEKILKSLIGRSADECVYELIERSDPELRIVASCLCNLLSKPFNSAERLEDRGIVRTEGRIFDYDVKDKKVGIIGYGLYNEVFLGKCKEFHAFDFRDPKGILNYKIGNETKVYPENICWHLGNNALEHKDVLESLDIVVMTGCTIVNNTYRDILKMCKNAKIRGIYGPSAELCPEYLFDIGYNYIFSASVRDKEAFYKSTFAAIPEGMDLSYMDCYELSRA
ncbi:Rossmann-like domain-containing protein [Lacrimispora sp.]|uniref:Rossmann-like domain-containing protein n=1 Tax=Lacrimispora sp. TaxID=2719234 RepID=UPI002FDB4842